MFAFAWTRCTSRDSKWPSYLPGTHRDGAGFPPCAPSPLWVPPAAELPTSDWSLPGALSGLVSTLVFGRTALLSRLTFLGPGQSFVWRCLCFLEQGGRPDEPAGAGTEQQLCPQPLRLAEPLEAELLPSGEPQAVSASVYSSTPPAPDRQPSWLYPVASWLCPPPPDPGPLGRGHCCPLRVTYLEMCR